MAENKLPGAPRPPAASVPVPATQLSKAFYWVTGLAALMVPATTAISGWFTRSKELQAEEQKQDYNIRLQFLGLAVDPKSTPEARHGVLRFLKTVQTKEDMKKWAEEELTSVDEQLKQAKDEASRERRAFEESQRDLAEKTKALAEANNTLQAARRSGKADKATIAMFEAAVTKARADQKKAEAGAKNPMASPSDIIEQRLKELNEQTAMVSASIKLLEEQNHLPFP
jgi:hypothetical protein